MMMALFVLKENREHTYLFIAELWPRYLPIFFFFVDIGSVCHLVFLRIFPLRLCYCTSLIRSQIDSGFLIEDVLPYRHTLYYTIIAKIQAANIYLQ
jgi:hypothetical protein